MPASIRPDDGPPDPEWLMPDPLWEQVTGLLPPEKPHGTGTKGGRPPVEPRCTMDAIFYILRTGCQWQWPAADGVMTKAPLAARRLVPTPLTGPSAA